jgi:hypothetical protein
MTTMAHHTTNPCNGCGAELGEGAATPCGLCRAEHSAEAGIPQPLADLGRVACPQCNGGQGWSRTHFDDVSGCPLCNGEGDVTEAAAADYIDSNRG